MKKAMMRVFFCCLVAAGVFTGSLLWDREKLNTELIRLHVVAASDAPGDQDRKLRVRDAVLADIRGAMEQAGDPVQARAYLEQRLPRLQRLAEDTLRRLGCEDSVAVSLCREAFDTRFYDTFTLPGGIYEALRITIGEGKGHNWWCVAFPTLCIPAVSREVEDIAADAGFSRPLRGALVGERPYALRFYLLDLLGKLQARGL